jgi:hypothetical protein
MERAFVATFVLLTTACTRPVTRSFDARGITTVVLRAANAPAAVVEHSGERVNVSGVPEGGARGYHSPNPGWRETPASEWGLDFVAARHGNVLVISTKNEIRFMHHRYVFEALKIRVPKGVTVIPTARELTGNGAADLSVPR